MEVLKNNIHIGIKEPFCVLHMSDTHLTYADMRDGQRKVDLAQSRSRHFVDADKDLALIKKKAVSENRTLICTGDLIDFVSELNLEKAAEFISSVDFLMSAGNHEFSLYVGEAFEDDEYRNQSLQKVQNIFNNDIRCSSEIKNGVNFVFLDNSYYLIEKEQFDFLVEQNNRGLPIILCVHTPLFSCEFYEFSKKGKGSPAYLMSVPEELMSDYPNDRYIQQKEDVMTARAYSFILNSNNIKAVLCGHIHENFEGYLNDKIYQIATGLSTVREIYID